MLRSIGKQEYVPVTNNCSRSNCKQEYGDAIRITDIRSAAAVIALAAMTVMPIDSVTLQSSITVTRHLHPALPPRTPSPLSEITIVDICSLVTVTVRKWG